jgi:branched-chain amino acid transport system substrate-binding protein
MQTIQGHITWSAGAPLNPVPNVCRTVLIGGEWVKGTTYPFELLLADTAHAKEAPFDVTIPENGKVVPIKY